MKQTMKTAAFLLAAMGMGYLGTLLSQTTHRALADTPATPPAVITAQKFELVDATGRRRADFAMNGDNPYLCLRDTAGHPRGTFAIVGDKPVLALFDVAGKKRGTFGIGEDNPYFCLYDSQERAREVITMIGDDPSFGLYDTAGKKRGAFGMTGDDPGMDLWDTSTHHRASFELFENMPNIFLYDAAGKIREHLRVDDKGSPIIAMSDDQKMVRAMLWLDDAEHNSRPAMAFWDADNNEIWSAH